MHTTHLDDIWQRASARWVEILAISPELAPAVTLQQRLIRLTLDASAQLFEPVPEGLTPTAIADKWRRRVPALRNVPVPMPESLKALLPALCDALAEGGAGDAARHIGEALALPTIDAGSLLAVSLARNQKAIRTSALHMGFSPDLVWLIGELGSAPLAHHLQQEVLGAYPSFQDWDRGYCPFCGSWPSFIESCRSERLLRCSFCALAWGLRAQRCVYCGDAGNDFVVAAPDLRRTDRRVELCATCGSYTKVIEVTDMTPFPLLAIEDLASMDLDRAAMGRDYRRPGLYDLDDIEPLNSAC